MFDDFVLFLQYPGGLEVELGDWLVCTYGPREDHDYGRVIDVDLDGERLHVKWVVGQFDRRGGSE